MRLILATILLTISNAAAAAPSRPEGLADRFVAAWNSHDPTAFEALYTADAVWVPVAEERTEGQASIVSEFAKIHTNGGWAIQTTIAKKDVPVSHIVRPGVATVFFYMDFIDHGKPGASHKTGTDIR